MANIITDEMIKTALRAVWSYEASTPQDNMRVALEAAFAFAERNRDDSQSPHARMEKGGLMKAYAYCTAMWCSDNPYRAAEIIEHLAARAERAEALLARCLGDHCTAIWRSDNPSGAAEIIKRLAARVERAEALLGRCLGFEPQLDIEISAALERLPDHG